MRNAMKRVILSLVALVVVLPMAAQAGDRPWRGPHTNHTVSTTLGLGLEYGFEWEYVERATVVARIGYMSKDFTLRSALDNFQWASSMVPGVTLEPRFYFWMNREELKDKYTTAFVGVPATATLRKDAKGLGEVVVTPRAGIRRAFARHWFHEVTAGADLLCYPGFKVSPHLGYRIGFLF
jgi:hypothetical protein